MNRARATRPRPVAGAVTLVLLVLLTACASEGSAPPEPDPADSSNSPPTVETLPEATTLPPPTVTVPPQPSQPPATPPSDAAILERRRQTWREAGLDSYQLAYSVDCDCPAAVDRNTVAVTSGGAGFVSGDPSVELLTVDRLFDLAAAAIAGGTLTTIEYDEELGYPVEMVIVGDDGPVTYEVRSLGSILDE